MDLDKLEKISKIATAIAIPVVLAVGGWIIQAESQSSKLSHDYVRLAVEILREDSTLEDEALRKWAVALLNEHSDVKLPEDTRESLISGKTSLPRQSNAPARSRIPDYDLPVPKKSKLLQIAVNEINSDVHEVDSYQRIREYWSALGIEADGLDRTTPWSGAFLSWVIAQTGNPNGITLSAANSKIWNDAVSKGFAYLPGAKQPMPGDLAFFTRRRASVDEARKGMSIFPAHAGIIFEVSDNGFTAIGGNVADGIRLEEYTFEDSSLVGYVRLE